MTRVLVLYASTHGHTGKIAERIAKAIGPEAELRSIDAAPAPLDYDVVIVGASVHAGHHQKAVRKWLHEHAAALNRIPSAFFSVCLTAADDTDEARADAQRYIDETLTEAGWQPRLVQSFAGALQYREYDFMTRLLMRLLMRKGGHPTDASRDYDYTDWGAVEKFGRACAALAPEPAGRPGF